jgi:serine/threonine protein kinase
LATPKTVGSLVGRVIAGKLELQTLLGQGSMGQVYRAQHTSLNKPIAIKVMRPEMKPTEEQLARFRAEAQASSRLDHPHTVQILDFGEDGDDKLLYIAMEFLQGEELSRSLSRDKQFKVERACRITRQVLAALSAAHDSDIVHRDIKPGNIMLVQRTNDEGNAEEWVKVCDFGIAKLLVAEEGVPPLTMEGVSLGTPAYAAPEQILGQTIDGRADLYATGIILYTMLAGKRPFDAETPMAMAMKHIKQAPPPLQEIRPELSAELCDIVFKAIAKKPENRFDNARQMRDALKSFVQSGNRNQNSISPPAIETPAPPEPIVAKTQDPPVKQQSSADFVTMAVTTDELAAAAKEGDAPDDLLRAFLEESGETPKEESPRSSPTNPVAFSGILDTPIVERTPAERIVPITPRAPIAEPVAAPAVASEPSTPVTTQRKPSLILWLGFFLLVSIAIIVSVFVQGL